MESGSISRERLILAGIQELEANGLSGFSLRKVAQRCGVSCAAPYKHFKDKGELVLAIAEHYNAQWVRRQRAVLARTERDVTRQLQLLAAQPELLSFRNEICKRLGNRVINI